MRALPLLSLLLGGWIMLPAHADEAQDWLDRLAQAEQQQSYQGTFVYERSGSFSTHRIWHRVDGQRVSERLLQLDGSAQEVVRVDGQTQCVSGKLASGVGSGQVANARLLDAKKLGALYEISVVGQSRVADRPAVVLALSPRDQYRYGFEMHLDKDTGLPLKSLLLNEKGQLLERFQFTQIDTRDVPTDAQLQPSAQCNAVAQQVVPDQQATQNWRSEWLPPGFELISSTVHEDAASNTQVSSLMYGDGLARFSVFLEPLKAPAAADTRIQLGPTVAVSRRLSTPEGEVMVTVVGEIPMGTAERIALSFRANTTQAKQ